jgi:hypothetical protein
MILKIVMTVRKCTTFTNGYTMMVKRTWTVLVVLNHNGFGKFTAPNVLLTFEGRYEPSGSTEDYLTVRAICDLNG